MKYSAARSRELLRLGSGLADASFRNGQEEAIRLTELRRSEQRQMQEYARLPFGAHMGFLIAALDGDPSAVRPPALVPLPTRVSDAVVREAVAYLRRTSLPIEPRKRWPDGGMPRYRVKGAIAPEHLAQPGRALCIWGDAGWGTLVRHGKYRDGHFADELVEACLKMLHQWKPEPAPVWITCIPSLRHPKLVPEFADRLARRLGLPFHGALGRTDDRPEQKTMANSTHQARNIDGSLALHTPVPRGSVLLVDDMVDSRWTLTVAAWLLRKGGCGEVWPLALSQAGNES